VRKSLPRFISKMPHCIMTSVLLFGPATEEKRFANVSQNCRTIFDRADAKYAK
jgi:hypothetical protein